MRIVRGIESAPPESVGGVVALGVFDGIHLGHRKILGIAVGRARDLAVASLACTFDPRPVEVLQPERAPVPITTLEERLELIAEAGIHTTIVLPFTAALARMEPEAFIEEMMLRQLGVREIVVGFNHRFGRGARGDPALLETLAARLGFRAHVVPPLIVEGGPVSSTEIRAALQRGDLERAQGLLGRDYLLGGEVVRGAGRGRTLGFPTANVKPDRPPLVPLGVYACWAWAAGRRHRAVLNVGSQPTFGENAVAIEAHLLDFEGDLYGCRLRLAFVRRLRAEMKFPSIDALRAQIGADAAAARRLL
ncbi:MAG: bifunctional riboflavin kinase/FAD synthetase [Candidatus Rokuibacteriota bacterium]